MSYLKLDDLCLDITDNTHIIKILEIFFIPQQFPAMQYRYCL